MPKTKTKTKTKTEAKAKHQANSKSDNRVINKVSSDAVEEATGRGWDGWIRWINRNGGTSMDHRAIVKLLATKGKVESGWWQQMVTVGYEHGSGRRTTGETADAGYQIGVQKAVSMGRDALWELLISRAGAKSWLGPVRGLKLEPGAAYRTSEGTTGEIRSVRPGEKLRLTWQPQGRAKATTLQLSLSCPRNTQGRTTLRFHHEKLADSDEREQMRAHWRAVLEEIEKHASPVARS